MNKSIGLIVTALLLGSRLALADGCSNWNDLGYFATASVATVANCLRNGTRSNARNERGDTPLHDAARFADDPATIHVLLEAGADPNAPNKRGRTPLHEAARYSRNSAAITVLLDEGADPDAADRRGQTPLHDAVARIRDDPVVVAALLAAGADPNAPDEQSRTPLHEAAENADDPTIVASLLEAGADPNATDEQSRTPLHEAAENADDPTVVASLLKAGADPNATDHHGLQPLGFVMERSRHRRNPITIAALLEAGADPNVRTRFGLTPLHEAVDVPDGLNTVIALLRAGGDPNAKALHNWKTGYSPRGLGETPLHHAARHDAYPATVSVLLDAGAAPNARSLDGSTPLHLAGHIGVFRRLLNAGADPNARTVDGYTPLHNVFLHGAEPLAPLLSTLLDAGADPLARTSDGFSPIHLAAQHANDPASIALLLDAGAHPISFNKGWSALSMAAVHNENPTVVAELLKAHIPDASAELLSPLQPGLRTVTCWFDAEDTWPQTECHYMVVNQDPNDALSSPIAFPVIQFSMHPRRNTRNPVLHLGGGGPGSPMGLHAHPSELWSSLGAMAWSSGRDIYVIDPRGVGMAIPRLNCPGILERYRRNLERRMTTIREIDDLDAAYRDCRNRLHEEGFNVSYYNSKAVARDVDALRRALNVEKWVLFGTSYASRYALTVARDFPDTVEAMILNGAVFPNIQYETRLVDIVGSAFEKALDRCDRTETCNADSLRTRFMDLVRALDDEHIMVDDLGADIGDIHGLRRFVLTGERLTSIVFAALYDESFVPQFRDLVEELERKEFATFSETLSLWLSLFVNPDDSSVVSYAHYCSESHPFVNYDAANRDALGAESYIRKYVQGWLHDLQSACNIWNIDAAEAVESEPIETSIPVLFLQGALDPIVPVEYLGDQLQYFANHSVLIFDDSSHWGSVYGSCAMDAVGYFIRHKGLHRDHQICARSN